MRGKGIVAKPPYPAQTAWSLASRVSECIVATWLVSDATSLNGCALSRLRFA
jgi:hypothetical protein